MALYWHFNEKIGYAIMHDDFQKKDFTVNLYRGNALLIMLYEDNEAKTYSLYSFFADKAHMENCLGLAKGTESIFGKGKIKTVVLYNDFDYITQNEAFTLAKAFIKHDSETAVLFVHRPVE